MSSELKQWAIELLLLVLTVLALASAPAHGAVLVSESTVSSLGYGHSTYTQLTAQLNAATGNDITVVTNFSNAVQVAAADALWLDIRNPADTLSAAEVANISAFIATGKRVVMIGDHVDWTTWDNSILAVAGGAWAADVDLGTVITPVAAHALTASVPSMTVMSGSASTAPPGATPLFNVNVVTLWGSSQNVLTVLDANLFDNFSRANAGTAQFGNNVAAWMGAPVPEPAGLALLAVAGVPLINRPRRR